MKKKYQFPGVSLPERLPGLEEFVGNIPVGIDDPAISREQRQSCQMRFRHLIHSAGYHVEFFAIGIQLLVRYG